MGSPSSASICRFSASRSLSSRCRFACSDASVALTASKLPAVHQEPRRRDESLQLLVDETGCDFGWIAPIDSAPRELLQHEPRLRGYRLWRVRESFFPHALRALSALPFDLPHSAAGART